MPRYLFSTTRFHKNKMKYSINHTSSGKFNAHTEEGTVTPEQDITLTYKYPDGTTYTHHIFPDNTVAITSNKGQSNKFNAGDGYYNMMNARALHFATRNLG
ncbi:MAG: hypothetical protein ABTQ34_03520 [Bdellovibrionales bacterium]